MRIASSVRLTDLARRGAARRRDDKRVGAPEHEAAQ
jgi:hypothetical protein